MRYYFVVSSGKYLEKLSNSLAIALSTILTKADRAKSFKRYKQLIVE